MRDTNNSVNDLGGVIAELRPYRVSLQPSREARQVTGGRRHLRVLQYFQEPLQQVRHDQAEPTLKISDPYKLRIEAGSGVRDVPYQCRQRHVARGEKVQHVEPAWIQENERISLPTCSGRGPRS